MPKNIVLLSDGTGNSAAKLFKTNVWRIYDCLDLRDPARQVACYDDGVGTSTFFPLALLGGAIGFGLKRNVLRLYRFLCEQYEPGDRIYAFGFSRGAFTIRTLVALIANQGIIRVRAGTYEGAAAAAAPSLARALTSSGGTAPDGGPVEATAVEASAPATMSGTELRRLSKRAYQQFRCNRFYRGLPIVWLARTLRDWYVGIGDGEGRYAPEWNVKIDKGGITFVGLWDTVDAYGLPIDELTKGVNEWIWPLSFQDLKLSDKVDKACHALSLDDERHTFHPVLWDETEEKQDATQLDEERVSQVWFAGVHANVGGGYPNDALSAVSLEWIAVEARKKKLLFLEEQLSHALDKRDPLGAMYDSRRGLGAYYRYSPRRILYLTNGQEHEKGFFHKTWPKPNPTVTIARPKIHESVFTRIKAAPDFYAPMGLPEDYAVVRAKDGRIVSGADYGFEAPEKRSARAQAQEVAWNFVWWRRVAYFASVITTLAILFWPMREGADTIADLSQRGGASRVVAFIGTFLPEMAAPWINYYAVHPTELAIGLGALGLLLLWGRSLRARIGDCMHTVWRYVIAPVSEFDVQPPEPRGLLYRARQHRYYHGSFAVFRRIVLPNAFGLLALVYLLAGANRMVFEALNVSGVPCQPSALATPVAAGVQQAFSTQAFCAPTGIALQSGVPYEMSVTFAGAQDGGIPVTRPGGLGVSSAGLTLGQRALFAGAFPFKRLWRANWFVVVARVGSSGLEQVPLNAPVTRFIARNDGELFLFVNDAIAPLGYVPGVGGRFGWSAYYANNGGTATIAIRPITDAAVAANLGALPYRSAQAIRLEPADLSR